VSRSSASQWAIALSLLVSGAQAVHSQNSDLDTKFKSALALYDSNHFPEAAAQLESILPQAPKSFDVHELLGQVYAAESMDQKAIEQLQLAVDLKPTSGPARTNLAASLLHAGKTDQAGEQFRKALALEPGNFDANHNLGEFYIERGKIEQAIPLLQAAQKINPGAYDNGYDLAMAEFDTSHLPQAREETQALLAQKNTAELHNLLAKIEEKDGKFVAAANEFQLAAHLEPSDDNLFDWGTELLLHRTYEPAIDVFQQATRLYPNSPRLYIGLGMALYARSMYEEAVTALLKAADLGPTDARCYLFLSRSYASSPNQASAVIEHFRRYAELQPESALAQYYYAMSMWKGKGVQDSTVDMHAIEALLTKAIALDGSLSEAHMQLANLYADQHEYEKSIPEYVRALELNPKLADAHYRLGTAYVHTGKKDQAQQEFELYRKLRAEHLAEDEKTRAEVQQFVISEKSSPAAKP
jgi:tetratricopeptide (TPR) repeat protein